MLGLKLACSFPEKEASALSNFRIVFGGSTGKSCKNPGGYYIIKFLGNYFSHPVRAPFVRSLCGSGTETGGGALTGHGALTGKNVWGIIFGGST